jgi:iron(III) transport system permease protein
VRKIVAKVWPWLAVGLLAIGSAGPLVAEPRTRQLALNTLWLVASVVSASLLIGVPLAILLVRTDAFGRKAAGWCLTVLMLLPLYVQAAAWQAGFGLQGWFTFLSGGHTLLQGFPATIWIHTAAAIPWIVVIVGLGLWFAEPELEELASLELRPVRVLASVTLRRAAPAIAVAAIWVALLTAGDMTVTNLFLVRTYAEEIYTQIAMGGEPGVAPLGTLSAVLGTAWLLLAGLLLATELARHGQYPSQIRPYVFRLGRMRTLASAGVWASLLLLAGVPIGNLVYKGGWLARHTSDGWQRWWSGQRLMEVVATSPRQFGQPFGWTLLLAALAACAALAIGIPLAWFARRRSWRRVLAWTLTAGCLALPGPIIGLSIIWLFQQPDLPLVEYLYDRTVLAPLVAQLIRALPLATIVLWCAFTTVPDELLDMAAIDGLSPWATLWRVVIPARLPGVFAAGCVAFAVAAGDLAATILVTPPGVMTLPTQIFNLIHSGVDDLVAGVCLTLILGYALITAIVVGLARRLGRSV